MSEAAPEKSFGCERCWPSDAEAAHEASRSLIHQAELIDESHFHVVIRMCGHCSQRYVSIFTEMIDWVDGEDPQYWTLLPITDDEAEELIRYGDSLTESLLNTLGGGRRCLQHDYPKDKPPRTSWGTGIFVGPHD